MTPALLAALLFIAGVILMVAEVLLPTHGLLGLLGVLSFAGTTVALYFVNQWLGVGTLAALVFSSPFWFMAAMRMWPKTPVGKRLVLNATVPSHPSQAASLQRGQEGVAMTEMRPMGECEFSGVRVQANSQLGIIAAGTKVRIVALDGHQPTVTAVA